MSDNFIKSSGDNGKWVTINGTHIFIKDGQSVEEALVDLQTKKDSQEKFKQKYSDEALRKEEILYYNKKKESGFSEKYANDVEGINNYRLDKAYNAEGKGYVGNRMSKNADEAHKSGEELPMSSWSLIHFKEKVNEEFDDINIKKIKGSYKDYLKKTSWHHTGKFYNITDFYSINYDKLFNAIDDGSIEIYTQDEIDSLKKVELQKIAIRNQEMEKYKIEREKEKQDEINEILESKIEYRQSKNGKTVATFIINESMPKLYNSQYIPIESLSKKVEFDRKVDIVQYRKASKVY